VKVCPRILLEDGRHHLHKSCFLDSAAALQAVRSSQMRIVGGASPPRIEDERLCSGGVGLSHPIESDAERKFVDDHVAVEQPDVLVQRGVCRSEQPIPEVAFHPRHMHEGCAGRQAMSHFGRADGAVIRIEEEVERAPA